MIALLERVVRAREAAYFSRACIEVYTVAFGRVKIGIDHMEALLANLDCTFDQPCLLSPFREGLLACLALYLG